MKLQTPAQKYHSYIEVEHAGERITLVFTNLSLRQAQSLDVAYSKHYDHLYSSCELLGHGWGVIERKKHEDQDE